MGVSTRVTHYGRRAVHYAILRSQIDLPWTRVHRPINKNISKWPVPVSFAQLASSRETTPSHSPHPLRLIYMPPTFCPYLHVPQAVDHHPHPYALTICSFLSRHMPIHRNMCMRLLGQLDAHSLPPARTPLRLKFSKPFLPNSALPIT